MKKMFNSYDAMLKAFSSGRLHLLFATLFRWMTRAQAAAAAAAYAAYNFPPLPHLFAFDWFVRPCAGRKPSRGAGCCGWKRGGWRMWIGRDWERKRNSGMDGKSRPRPFRPSVIFLFFFSRASKHVATGDWSDGAWQDEAFIFGRAAEFFFTSVYFPQGAYRRQRKKIYIGAMKKETTWGQSK